MLKITVDCETGVAEEVEMTGAEVASLGTEAQAEQVAWATLRAERNARLAQTDWVGASDAPDVQKQVLLPYRQELRDLPANTADPFNPEWPEQP